MTLALPPTSLEDSTSNTVLDAVMAKALPCAIRHWEALTVPPSQWFLWNSWDSRLKQPAYTQVEAETFMGGRHTGACLVGFSLDRYTCLERDIKKVRFLFPQGHWKQSVGKYAHISGVESLLREEGIHRLGERLLAETGTFGLVLSIGLSSEFLVKGWVFTTSAVSAAQLTGLLGGEPNKSCYLFETSLEEFLAWAKSNLVLEGQYRIAGR